MALFFTRALAAALMTAAAVALAATPQEKLVEAKRNPIQAPGTVWAFDGFLVTIPNDPDWYSTAKDAHYADLSKDFADGLKAAIVIEASKLEDGTGKEEELLKRLREEQTALPDAAMKLLDYSAEAFAPKGVLCVRFVTKFDDRRSNFAAPGTLLVRGVGCVPPGQPDVIVTVRYAQRSADSEWSAQLRAIADPVLDSLRFVPTNEHAMAQAREAVRSDRPGDAIGMLTPSAQEGDAEAALFLGNIYLYGRGVTPDYEAARRWLELASKEGRVDALFNLGAMYDKGIGVPRDVQQALHWFTLAADQRDAVAQLNLALIYINGNGVPRDVTLGQQWLRRSAANGNKRAEGLLKMGPPRQP
jgi:TPR repeat protein